MNSPLFRFELISQLTFAELQDLGVRRPQSRSLRAGVSVMHHPETADVHLRSPGVLGALYNPINPIVI